MCACPTDHKSHLACTDLGTSITCAVRYEYDQGFGCDQSRETECAAKRRVQIEQSLRFTVTVVNKEALARVIVITVLALGESWLVGSGSRVPISGFYLFSHIICRS